MMKLEEGGAHKIVATTFRPWPLPPNPAPEWRPEKDSQAMKGQLKLTFH